METGFLAPPEIAGAAVEIGVKKAKTGALRLLVLGFMAGAFIAFAAEGSNMAAYNLLARPETYGLGKCLAGAIFGTGLMLVLAAGGELFTGNNLLLLALWQKRISPLQLLRNWALVYAGNLLGALFIAWLMLASGLFNSSNGLLGGMTVKIAASKTGLSFFSAFVLGILCNILVCGAVWISFGAKDITGKLLACFFPIWLFITSGFEHSVANMYYIPAGIWAKADPVFAAASGVAAEALAGLNCGIFLVKNLLPVTLGNIVGGGLIFGGAYWLAYLREEKR